MHLIEKNYEQSKKDFFESFLRWDESGIEEKRIISLKYIILVSMLEREEIIKENEKNQKKILYDKLVDPLNAPETKSYKTNKEIQIMSNLLEKYQSGDLIEFENIINKHSNIIFDDMFLRYNIEELLKKIRTKALLDLILPYNRIKLTYISKTLNINLDNVENLLCSLILDKVVDGQIDQINKVLILKNKYPFKENSERFILLEKWKNNLNDIFYEVQKKHQNI
jgi:COP9 signalosome complex subunit 2